MRGRGSRWIICFEMIRLEKNCDNGHHLTLLVIPINRVTEVSLACLF